MKIYINFSIFCMLAIESLLISCTREEVADTCIPKQISITVSDFMVDKLSKSVFVPNENSIEFLWGKNDTVGIFPNTGTQVAFPIFEGTGSHTATFNGGGWLLKEAATYSAYFPYSHLNTSPEFLPISYKHQKQRDNNSTAHLGKYDFMVSKPLSPVKNSVNFVFSHLSSLVQLDLKLPQIGQLASVELRSDDVEFLSEGYVNLLKEDPMIEIKNISGSMRLVTENIQTEAADDVVTVYFMLAPKDFLGKPVDVIVDNNGVKYSKELRLNKLEAGKAYKFKLDFSPSKEISKTIHIEVPGTLDQLISKEEKYQITKLILEGNINGTDVRFIRDMAGRSIGGGKTSGIVRDLDMSNVFIVEGGEAFIKAGEMIKGYTEPGGRSWPSIISSHNVYTKANSGTFMFAGLDKLINLKLPTNLTSLGECSCYGCHSLKSVVLPFSLYSQWNNDVFGSCASLTNIDLLGGHPLYKSQDQYIYDYEENKIVLIFPGLKVFQVPTIFTSVSSYAFVEGNRLEELYITNQQLEISDNRYHNPLLFLKNFHVASSNPYFTEIDGVLYSKDTLKIIRYPSNRKEVSFTLPDAVKIIGKLCFQDCNNFTNVNLQEGVEELEEDCFDTYTIRSVTLPTTIKKIGRESLENLYEVIIKSSTPPSLGEKLGKWVKVYVPDDAVDAYKTADVWKNSANQIFPMSHRKMNN